MPEVGQNACVYYDPLKGDSLADNLSDLLFDNVKLKELSNLGLNHSKKFTGRQQLEKLLLFTG